MHGRVSSIFPSVVTGRATRWIDGLPCSATVAMNSSGRLKTKNLLPSCTSSLILIVSLTLSPKVWHIADGSTTRNLPGSLLHRLRIFVHRVCVTAWWDSSGIAFSPFVCG